MTYQLVVLFERREVPPGFLSEEGTLEIGGICPPHDVEGVRLMPKMVLAGWTEKIEEPQEAKLPYQKLAIPDLSELSDIEGISTTRSLFAWRHHQRLATQLLDLSDETEMSLMSISFLGSSLQFRFRTFALAVEMDCTWASMRLGTAVFRWEPGRISISYFSTSEEGLCESRIATVFLWTRRRLWSRQGKTWSTCGS